MLDFIFHPISMGSHQKVSEAANLVHTKMHRFTCITCVSVNHTYALCNNSVVFCFHFNYKLFSSIKDYKCCRKVSTHLQMVVVKWLKWTKKASKYSNLNTCEQINDHQLTSDKSYMGCSKKLAVEKVTQFFFQASIFHRVLQKNHNSLKCF